MKTINKTLSNNYYLLITIYCLLNTFNSYSQGAGSALDFDGVDDYVSLPTAGFGNNNTFSLELWLKPTSIKAGVHLWEGIAESAPSFEGASNSLNFWLSNSFSLNTGILTIGEWHHIVAVYNKITQTQSLYVNGVLKGQNTSINVSDTFGNTLYFCDRQNGGFSNNNRDFPGSLDEVRIWNKALTQTEIQQNMCKKLTGTEAGLVAYYPMNEGIDNTCSGGEDVCDRSGNGNNGTKF